jgi:hypothetical protein
VRNSRGLSLIRYVSYFYLQHGAIMASLKVWNENIEHVASLVEVWVHVRGITPKVDCF